jgi:hypothetical protein
LDVVGHATGLLQSRINAGAAIEERKAHLGKLSDETSRGPGFMESSDKIDFAKLVGFFRDCCLRRQREAPSDLSSWAAQRSIMSESNELLA